MRRLGLDREFRAMVGPLFARSVASLVRSGMSRALLARSDSDLNGTLFPRCGASPLAARVIARIYLPLIENGEFDGCIGVSFDEVYGFVSLGGRYPVRQAILSGRVLDPVSQVPIEAAKQAAWMFTLVSAIGVNKFVYRDYSDVYLLDIERVVKMKIGVPSRLFHGSSLMLARVRIDAAEKERIECAGGRCRRISRALRDLFFLSEGYRLGVLREACMGMRIDDVQGDLELIESSRKILAGLKICDPEDLSREILDHVDAR